MLSIANVVQTLSGFICNTYFIRLDALRIHLPVEMFGELSTFSGRRFTMPILSELEVRDEKGCNYVAQLDQSDFRVVFL